MRGWRPGPAARCRSSSWASKAARAERTRAMAWTAWSADSERVFRATVPPGASPPRAGGAVVRGGLGAFVRAEGAAGCAAARDGRRVQVQRAGLFRAALHQGIAEQ